MDDAVILAIMERVQSEMPNAIVYIDEDYGQLEDEDKGYQYPFPWLLIGNSAGDWENLTSTTQKGENSLVLRLVQDCYDDTHIGSGTEAKISVRAALNKSLYECLQGYRIGRKYSAFRRIKSRDYTVGGGLKVYEVMLGYKTHDDSAAL